MPEVVVVQRQFCKNGFNSINYKLGDSAWVSAVELLSLAARVVVDDWEEAYGVRPVLLETFVERDRYEGTCYLAANWVEVGVTAGRGRMDRHKKKAKPVKTCLVYPLVRDFRRRLGVMR